MEQIAKIRNVHLGWEDHGIFTCVLDLDYGGSGQSAGSYALDNPGESNDRVGTAYGMEWVIRLMRACDVNDFSEIKGKTVIAIRDEGYNGLVRGIKPLPTESGREFIFDDLTAEFRNRFDNPPAVA